MNDKFLNKEYRIAVQRILRKNAKVLEKPDHELTYEEAQENFRKRLKEVSEEILNGERDEEIENEIKLMREEQKKKDSTKWIEERNNSYGRIFTNDATLLKLKRKI